MTKNHEPSYYAILTAEVRYDNELSSSEKIFFAEITALCNMRGVCFASNKYFAKFYDCAPSTVSGWVKTLRAKGYIEVDYIRDKKQIKRRLIKPVGTPKTPFEAFEGIQISEGGYSENPKGGIQISEGGYSENPKDNNSMSSISKSNNRKESTFFEKEEHPLVKHIKANYKRVSKMTEPMTDEEAVRFMKDYKKQYPDLFPTDKDLKIEIDRVLQDLNNHKAVKNNISANKTLRKFMNNHIEWHLTPNKKNNATGKGRLLSISDANNLYTENFASTNGTGIDFDKIFDHVEGQGKNKKYRVNPDYKDQIKKWVVKK